MAQKLCLNSGVNTYSYNQVVRLVAVICITLFGLIVPAYSQVYVGGELITDETYSPDNNPYIVTQNLVVGPGLTLNLLPGVEMKFESGTSLIVNGTLIAKGINDQKIKFLPKTQSTLNGLWNGLIFNNTKTLLGADSSYVSGSVLSNAVLSNASYSVTLDYNTALLIDSVDISRCSFGVYMKESGYNTIRNSFFSNCNFGIFMASGFLNSGNKIYGNSISGCSDVGIFINSNTLLSNNNFITGNWITVCNIGIHVGNYSNTGPGFNVISGNSFSRNKDAIKLFRHSNSVSSNYFKFNRNGVICWQSDNNTIKNNLFSGNVMNAVTLAAGSSYNSVSNNSMNYNYCAAMVKPDSLRNSVFNSFLYNTVCQNTGFSFQLLNSPQGPVQFNNIIQNGGIQSFENMSDTIVHAEYCFWGTISENEIDSIIYDVNDGPQFGKVLYKPILENILTSAPVPPPDRVIKQTIGNEIVVSWKAPEFADFKGFNVYSGKNDGINFEHKSNNGTKRTVNMGAVSIEDSIAVTAYDLTADGTNDQTEGYESDLSYAVMYPYAGPDTAICFNSEYSIIEATAYNYENVFWSTTGDGTFNNQVITNPVYTPGQQDYINGFVYLFLNDAGFGLQHIDSALITFHDAPNVFAGNDTVIILDSAFRLQYATASGYDILKWTTSGDGTFDSDSLSNPVYTPGSNDLASGEVILSISAISACGSASDQIKITLNPGFSVEGRVHAGSVLASNSSINLFQVNGNKVQPFRSGLLAVDGNFRFKALPGGKYYILAVPDKTSSSGYVPTYYFNDIHWENAYKLELHDNIYDVDIDLASLKAQIPEGECSILGYCTSLSGSTESCGDVTVFLYDKQKKNILDWFQVLDGGDFRFKRLPFGSYVLAGEKAGNPVFYSGDITLTPGQPFIENIELLCIAAGFRFSMPPDFAGSPDPQKISIYPNPVTDNLTINGLTETGKYNVRIFNSQGLVEKYYLTTGNINDNLLFLPTLPSGLYIIEVWNEGSCKLRQKLIKR